MSAQDMIFESRMTHIRELKAELEKLRRENAALKDENSSLKSHLDLASLAAEELGKGEAIELWDGWNMILGAQKEARDRSDLLAQAKAHVAENPADFVWIVLDGHRASSTVEGRVRVTYTGGAGRHRADRLVCDFLRMARFRGDLSRIEVRTNDKDFLKEVKRIRG